MCVFGSTSRLERLDTSFYFGSFLCERRLTFVSGGGHTQWEGEGCFSKSLPSHFSRWTAAGMPGSAACRASIRFFAAPCAQCQEVSRPEFTLTHSIRSFVRPGRGGLHARSLGFGERERAGFAAIFIPPLIAASVRRSPFPRLVFMVLALPTIALEFWHSGIVFCSGKKLRVKYRVLL